MPVRKSKAAKPKPLRQLRDATEILSYLKSEENGFDKLTETLYELTVSVQQENRVLLMDSKKNSLCISQNFLLDTLGDELEDLISLGEMA